MDPKLIEARENVIKARESLRRGDKETARDLGEKAVLLVPDLEDAWLVLVAADPNPEDALAYAQKALELNPQSTRAHKAVEWATAKLRQHRADSVGDTQPNKAVQTQRFEEAVPVMTLTGVGVRNEAPVLHPVKREVKKSPSRTEKKSNQQTLIYAGIFLGLLICVVMGIAGWWAIHNPTIAALLHIQKEPTQEALWARVNVPKPGATPIHGSAFAPQPTSVLAGVGKPTLVSTTLPTRKLAATSTALPTDAPTSTPAATETPGVMAMDILADTPTSVYVPPTAAPPAAVVAKPAGSGARWIDVNLSTQSVYAYEGDTVVNSFIVSTGTWIHPTVTGQFKIYIKLVSGNMSGPGYFLPNVPYIMYFYKSYGLHGTYWHNNFGTPMSHGCVNLRTSDAQWLYNWASLGTVVNVHY